MKKSCSLEVPYSNPESIPLDEYDIEFQLYSNQRLGIFGPSGCGKTTFLRNLAGLYIPNSDVNHYSIKGKDTKSGCAKSIHQVAFTQQRAPLIPHFTVDKHLKVVDERAWQRKIKDLKLAAIEALELSHLLSRFPNELSGGEQQRVSLACALIQQPNLLLLDEPFTGLDSCRRKNAVIFVQEVINSLDSNLILVSHSMTELLALTQSTLIMENSKQVDFGLTQKVLSRYSKKVNAKSIFIEGTVNGFKNEFGQKSDLSSMWATIASSIGEIVVPSQNLIYGQQVVLVAYTNEVELSTNSGDSSVLNRCSAFIKSIRDSGVQGLSEVTLWASSKLIRIHLPMFKIKAMSLESGQEVTITFQKLDLL